MDFSKLLSCAKCNDTQAIEKVFELYTPLLITHSMQDGKFIEDLYQENCVVLLRCIKNFKQIENNAKKESQNF